MSSEKQKLLRGSSDDKQQYRSVSLSDPERNEGTLTRPDNHHTNKGSHSLSEHQYGKHGSSKYKIPHNISTTAFETLSEEISRQRNVTRLARSQSASAVPTLTPNNIHAESRRALYGSLPFVAAFGMQHRENRIFRVLSTVSTTTLESLAQESEHKKLLPDIDMDNVIMTFPLVMTVIIAAIAEFLLGYNTGVMNAPANVVFPGHTTAEWSLAVSAFAIGGPFGAFTGGSLANKRGRRGAMMINTWIFFIGGLLMCLAPNVYWLIPARLIIGFASGSTSVVIPVYLGEIAPPTLRGSLGTVAQFSLTIGILMSNVFAFPLATVDNWRYLFAITPIFCIAQFALSPFLLESPRWLLNRDENSVEARLVIKRFRGFRNDQEVEEEVRHFLFADLKHKTPRNSAHSSGAFLDLLSAKDQRVLVISCIVLQMAQQLCGINAVFYYSTTFFEGLISNPLLGSTLVTLVNVLATYLALKLMDNTARRTLILWSAGGMIISTGFVLSALLGTTPNIVALIAVNFFVAFFEIGLGPIPWLIVAEMFDAKYVATAMSLSCIVNWACNFLVGLCFPFMQELLGPYSFGPFGIVLVSTFIFTYTYLPETYGRSVEEIQRLVGSPLDDEYAMNMEIISVAQDDFDSN